MCVNWWPLTPAVRLFSQPVHINVTYIQRYYPPHWNSSFSSSAHHTQDLQFNHFISFHVNCLETFFSFSKAEFISVCSKLCLSRIHRTKLQETFCCCCWDLHRDNSAWPSDPQLGSATTDAAGQGKMDAAPGSVILWLSRLTSLTGTECTDEDKIGCSTEWESSRVLRGFLLWTILYGLQIWTPALS